MNVMSMNSGAPGGPPEGSAAGAAAAPGAADGTAGRAVTIRALAEADWSELRAARLAALADAPYAFASTLAREQEFARTTWRDRAASGRTFGAWQGSSIVGLATGFPAEPGPAGTWWACGSRPGAAGQGIADRLVAAVCELARQSAAPSVTLWVTDANDRARAFYRRLGFTPTGGRAEIRAGVFEEELALPLR